MGLMCQPRNHQKGGKILNGTEEGSPDRKTTATASKAQAKKPTKAAKKTGTSGAGVVPPKRAPKAYNQVKNPERQNELGGSC